MTAQPSLPLVLDDACPVGTAAAIVEDDDGGRVFVHGNLAYAWDAGDSAARRFAAVSLMRIKAATQLEVAEAFAVKPATVRRWETRLTDAGLAGLLAERKGPKRKSKLTGDTVAAIRRLREDGSSYRAIAAAAGVSEGSVRNALKDTDTEEPCAPIGSDAHRRTEPEIEVEREVEIEVRTEEDCPATISAAPVTDTGAGAADAVVPVLADPAPRAAERALARFGLIPAAPPVFTRCARAPLAGLLLACPRWRDRAARDRARHLRRVAERVLLAGYDAVRERVPRPAGPGPRGGRGTDRPGRAGAGAGFGPGAGGEDDPPQDPAARRRGQGRRLDRRDGASSCPGPPRAGGSALRRRACARLPGHPRDRENPCAAVEVPRPGHGGNLGVRCRRGSAAGGDGRTGRFPGRRAAPADPRAARHGRRRPAGAGRVRPRRLVPDAVRRPARGRVRHPDLAQGRHRRHRRAQVRHPQPHRRARPHPHLAARRHRDRTGHRRRASRRARCSRCDRSACSMPPQPGRCTS